MCKAKTLITLKTVALGLWPPTVLAAQLTFGEAVERVTALEWALVALLSTLAGVTALLIRLSDLANNTPPDQEIPPVRSPALLVSSHMMGSWLVGLLAFFGSAHFGMPGLLVGFFVPAVSFGGARAAERIYLATVGRAFPLPQAPGKDQP